MGWFQRQAEGRDELQVQREHARYLRAAGVDRALETLSGPYGLRRFLLFFERRGGGVRVTELDAQALKWGGGPPPVDATGVRLSGLERALTHLHRNMASGPAWDRGALGFLRDAEGGARLFTWFDDDCGLAVLDRLPLPGPPGHPLESNEYEVLLARWEQRMASVHTATQARSSDRARWSIDETGWLALWPVEAVGAGGEVRRHRVVVLATWLPTWARFEWKVDEPLFDDEVFRHSTIACDLGGAMELAVLAAARLDAIWLFSGALDSPPGTLFAAVMS